MVRTSGEFRISNYLLWELAYSELVFTDVLWPDFRKQHLADAIREYQARERRFGGVAARARGRSAVALYRDQGIVLRTYKLGEADRIVVVHDRAPRQGPGRRQGRAQDQVASSAPASSRRSHVALQLYEGRELDIVTQAESIDHFRAIREDLDRLTRAVTMLEAVDQLSLEREPNPDLYRMLLGGAAHARRPQQRPGGGRLPLEAARPRGLPAHGRALRRVRRAPTGWWRSTPTEGGLLCAEHRRGTRVSPEAVRLLQHILGGRLAVALDEPASPATHEVDHLATRVDGAPPGAAAALGRPARVAALARRRSGLGGDPRLASRRPTGTSCREPWS